MLIHPIRVSERFPIGSVIEANAPPGDDWMICNGAILAQADYPTLYGLMERPHPVFESMDVLGPLDATGYGSIYQVATDGTYFVGASDDGLAFYSTDGETWSHTHFPTVTGSAYGCVYNGSMFMITPYSGSTYCTSTNGTSWTERTFPVSFNKYRPVWDGTYWYVVSYNSIYFYRSSNGIDWTQGQTLPSTSWMGIAASPDAVIISNTSGLTYGVSYDNGTSFDFYNTAKAMPVNIHYDSVNDIFIQGFTYEGVIAYSAGDDGKSWEFNNLMISRYGNQGGNSYGLASTQIVTKVGNYYFNLNSYGNQCAYSSDLKTWDLMTIPYNEYWDGLYNSSSGNYYLFGYGNYYLRFSGPDYNTGTHFRLPNANLVQSPYEISKLQKFIRVK